MSSGARSNSVSTGFFSNGFARITNNLGLKLMALSLAALLSYYVYLYIDYPYTQLIQLPLRVDSLSQSLVIVQPNPFPRYIEIKVRGPYREIRNLMPGNYPAKLECQGILEPGSATIPIIIPDLGDVIITHQEMETINLRFEERATKQLQIQINKLGEINKNFTAKEEALSRTEVDIDGPKSLVERAASAEIQVNVSDLDSDIKHLLPIILRDSDGQSLPLSMLTIKPAEVEYTLKVIPLGSIKVLQVIPDYQGQPPEDYMLVRVRPNPPWIQISSDLVPEGVSFLATTPIDLTNARNVLKKKVSILYPFELPIDTDLPRTCEVTLDIISLEEFGGERLQPELVGEDAEQFRYIITPPQISIISEELTQLDERTKKQITAKLYLEGLPVGEWHLTPQIFLPPALDHVKINPSTLTVTIIKRED